MPVRCGACNVLCQTYASPSDQNSTSCSSETSLEIREDEADDAIDVEDVFHFATATSVSGSTAYSHCSFLNHHVTVLNLFRLPPEAVESPC